MRLSYIEQYYPTFSCQTSPLLFRQLGPVLEEVNKNLGEKVKICKMNVDEAPATAASFEIRSIPTMFLFKDGEKIDTKVGFNSQSSIEDWLNSHLH